MKKVHILKIELEYYMAVLRGRMTFQLRLNDRDYKVDNIVVLSLCTKDRYGVESGENHNDKIKLIHSIGYILDLSVFGMETGYVTFSLKYNNLTSIELKELNHMIFEGKCIDNEMFTFSNPN